MTKMRPDTKVPEHEFIQKYWDILAGVAWHEFQLHGRGAFLIMSVGDEIGDIVYAPLEMLAASPLYEGAARMACEYEPTREVVAIFVRGSVVTSYQGGPVGCDAPPEVYRLMKAAHLL